MVYYGTLKTIYDGKKIRVDVITSGNYNDPNEYLYRFKVNKFHMPIFAERKKDGKIVLTQFSKDEYINIINLIKSDFNGPFIGSIKKNIEEIIAN
ncbi:hypothetical protein J4433_03195 [Candidatus Pacearchaeota archaeon]|nr:hypothetical protein [Candidatus Pacearchaeota archaeon]